MTDPVSFGRYVFARSSHSLQRDGEPVALGSRAAALLDALIAANGGVVRKAELIDAAWPNIVVEDRNLTVQIAALRNILGERADGQPWIKTVARVGYRLVRDMQPPVLLPSGKPSLVVLPFLNLSNDPEQEYFADGVVEDLITALSRFKTFSVVARNSAFVYKGRAVDVRQVAKDLCIRYVVEGSVRRTGDRLRIAAQLINAGSGAHLWAENFDTALGNIFDVQDRITESVVGLVEPQISSAEIDVARRKHPESLDAYDLYLRALPSIYSADIRSFDRAVDLLDRAVELDPTFPQVLAHAAWAHELRDTWGGRAPPGVDDLAISVSLAEQALIYGQHDAIVLALAGLIFHHVKGDHAKGLALIERALTMNPNSHHVLNVAGIVYSQRSELETSTECYLRALRLSPGAPDNYWSLGGIATNCFKLGRFEEAIEWARRADSLGSNWQQIGRVLAAAYALTGQLDDARSAVTQLLAVRPDLTISKLWGRKGRPDEIGDDYFFEGMRLAGLPEGDRPAL
jgi:TolB-like protein